MYDGPTIIRIAATGNVSPSTARRVLLEGAGNAYSRARVADACRRLGLPEPTAATSANTRQSA